MAEQPATLQLRYLQTLTEIASERNSTVVFPIPIDLINMFMEGISANGRGGGDRGPRRREVPAAPPPAIADTAAASAQQPPEQANPAE
jgi:hypothetical protein